MKKFLAGAMIATGISGHVFAADLPARNYTKASPILTAPIPNWSGWYAGVNGGYGWADNTQFGLVVANPQGVKPQGGFGGGQIGYNWQISPNWIFGVETDLQGSGIEQTVTSQPFGDQYTTKLDWFGTFRGRVGYAFTSVPLLIYGTGGLAYGELKELSPTSPLIGTPYSFNDTVTGYAVGGGAEWKFTPQWSAKVEYQYINLGKHDPISAGGGPLNITPGSSFSSTLPGFAILGDAAFHTVRAGINYHFN